MKPLFNIFVLNLFLNHNSGFIRGETDCMSISGSVFHDAFHFSQEKTRTSSSFAAQNVRQAEYTASPPTRRDVNSYTRGLTGKWEGRSRDGDSQTDRVSGISKIFDGLCISIRSLLLVADSQYTLRSWLKRNFFNPNFLAVIGRPHHFAN